MPGVQRRNPLLHPPLSIAYRTSFSGWMSDILHMAIIGDERWKSDAFAFTGNTASETQTRFHPSAGIMQVHAWLDQP